MRKINNWVLMLFFVFALTNVSAQQCRSYLMLAFGGGVSYNNNQSIFYLDGCNYSQLGINVYSSIKNRKVSFANTNQYQLNFNSFNVANDSLIGQITLYNSNNFSSDQMIIDTLIIEDLDNSMVKCKLPFMIFKQRCNAVGNIQAMDQICPNKNGKIIFEIRIPGKVQVFKNYNEMIYTKEYNGNLMTDTISNLSEGMYQLRYAIYGSNYFIAYDENIFVGLVKPVSPILTGNSIICLGSSVKLTPNLGGGTWVFSGTDKISVNNGNIKGISTGLASVTYTVGTGNCLISESKTINVVPIPSAGTLGGVLTSTGKFALCPTTTRSITTTVAGGVWSSLNNSIATVNNSGLVTGVAVGATSVKYTVTNTYGCTNTVSKSVIVDSKPITPVIYGTNLMMCQNGKGYLTASLPNGKWSTIDTYLKFSTLNNGIFYQQNTIPVDNFISGVKYTVSSTNNACTSEGTKEIKLRKLAQKVVSVSATNTNLLVNQQVTATASTTMTSTGAWRSFLPASLSATVSPTNNKQAIIKGLAVGTNAYVMFQSKDVSTGCTNGGWLTFNVTASQSIVDANPTTVSTTTGVDVYPNPSKGVVTFENIAGANAISLVDMTGRTIKTVAVNADRMTVDFSGVQNGKYLVQVAGENVNEVRSIVIE